VLKCVAVVMSDFFELVGVDSMRLLLVKILMIVSFCVG